MPSSPGFRAWFSEVKLDRAFAKRAATVGLPAFGIGYLLTAVLFFGGGPREAVVTVPDVRNLSADDARRALDRLDLQLEITDSLPNGRVAEGAVLAQSPLPGRETPPETQINVILSRGAERRAVPRVDGYPRPQAERILTASGFRVVVVSVPDARRPGQVVGTTPAAGTAMEMPARVRLLISAGPPMVAVPSVVGLLQGEAAAALSGAGLRAGQTTAELRLDMAPGLILSQSPQAGATVPGGTEVDMHVVTHDAQPETDAEPVGTDPEAPDAAPAPPEENRAQ